MKRECGSCTKCCEGFLSGEVKGKKFYLGKPCHFVAIGKNCTIYQERPKDPCISYRCEWITNQDIPFWMKPSEVNSIVDFREINKISYLNVIEAGETLRSDVLTFLIEYALTKQLNFCWKINGGNHYIGSPEFVKAMEENK